MTSKSKIKGNKFERDIVKAVELHDIKAVRAWGSNGASIGQHPEVDLLINDEIKVQAKVRKALPKWIRPSENVDVQIIKEDRGKMYVVQELNDWLIDKKR